MLKKLKRRLFLVINNIPLLTPLKHFLININLILFHWNERQHKIKLGNRQKSKIYYIVRPSGTVEGLLSLYYSVSSKINWAINNGYIPYIDFKNYKTQYNVDREVNGSFNAWEYYFTQVNDISVNELYNAKNIILSGWTFKRNKLESQNNSKELYYKNSSYFNIQPYINEMLNEKKEKLFKNQNILGVFLRGTDYIKLKPKGHWIQPSYEMVLKKVKEFMAKYPVDKIFLVTEDYSIYTLFCNEFQNKVFCSDDSFVKNYHGEDYVANSFKDDPYERGLNYLMRLLLLSECKYLVSSLATGSIFSINRNSGKYKDKFIFDLGVYQ